LLPTGWTEKSEHNGAVHQLFIDFEEAYDPIRAQVLYNILTEFSIPTKLPVAIKCVSTKLTSKICLIHFLFRTV